MYTGRLAYLLLVLAGLQLFGLGTLTGQVLRGEVVDEDGVGLRDAYIWLGDGSRHAHADEFGRFQLNDAGSGDTLLISYLGFETLRRILSAKDFDSTVQIVMIEKTFELDQVQVTNDVQLANRVAQLDLETQPVNSSQELLRRIPGLFIGQHAGGGKAEQMFLRGFDVDHGTDVRVSVDGIPVNMVSHAHGQGYADLHFLIPETVETLDFGKGPYYAEQGDFNTAGYVAFHTKEALESSSMTLEYGQFNTLRAVGLIDILNDVENQNAYVAGEFLETDGPFQSPQNFNRFNLLAKYTAQLPNSGKISISASHLTSKWDASGQVPQRAIESGMIDRYGAIDNTEGGNTTRSNFILTHTKPLSPQAYVKSIGFYSHYTFELFSNFTFFLEDPVHGDQIRQKEARDIYGFESSLHHQWIQGSGEIDLTAGVGLRYDAVHDDELSHTANRYATLKQLSFGNVDESNVYAYSDLRFRSGDWLINPGIRTDYFRFDYVDKLASAYTSLSYSKAIVSPKFNIIYNPNRLVQYYLKSGIGFHSNDARVVVQQQGVQTLPFALGTDLGLIWKPYPRVLINSAFWYLYLEQEFVYVGDAAVVEPSGKTNRYGIESGFRYQVADWLFLDFDGTYSIARSQDAPEGSDHIPLAPRYTATGGLSINHPSGVSAGIRCRYMGDRPATEDNSIVATGYFVTDASLSYTRKQVTFGIRVDNVFNTEWNETQFATESRLKEETQPVEEIHFTPGTPFAFRGKISYSF